MAEFGHEIELDVRFRDIDALGHVNNAVYSTYLEQARLEYLADVVGVDLLDADVVLGAIDVDFRRPVEYGESITVRLRAGELGTSSIPLENEVRADGEVAATAEAVMVTYDPVAGEPRPIPDAWRERIRAHEGRTRPSDHPTDANS
jgi:acyl-CoA thioester hydrolase